ncbi:MAG: hypothetical protein ACYS26_15095 [Planctomycetota bacterium]|jgi:hypothetical protein
MNTKNLLLVTVALGVVVSVSAIARTSYWAFGVKTVPQASSIVVTFALTSSGGTPSSASLAEFMLSQTHGATTHRWGPFEATPTLTAPGEFDATLDPLSLPDLDTSRPANILARTKPASCSISELLNGYSTSSTALERALGVAQWGSSGSVLDLSAGSLALSSAPMVFDLEIDPDNTLQGGAPNYDLTVSATPSALGVAPLAGQAFSQVAGAPVAYYSWSSSSSFSVSLTHQSLAAPIGTVLNRGVTSVLHPTLAGSLDVTIQAPPLNGYEVLVVPQAHYSPPGGVSPSWEFLHRAYSDEHSLILAPTATVPANASLSSLSPGDYTLEMWSADSSGAMSLQTTVTATVVAGQATAVTI